MPLFVRAAFVILGFAVAASAIPLLRRRVPPNGHFGFRVPATIADEWVWYETNVWSGRGLIALGLLVAALALVLPRFWVTTRPEHMAYTLAAIFVGGALLNTLLCWRLANRLLTERRAP